MTLSETRADLVAQCQTGVDLYKGTTLDPDGSMIQDADALNDLISRACLWWAKLTYCRYEPSVALTLTASQAEYDLRSTSVVGTKILKPRTVTINSNTLYRRDGKRYGLWTFSEMQRSYPAFRTAADAVPTLAVWLASTNKLLVHAPPAATYSGLNFIEGWTIPAPLTASDDNTELPAPEEDHPAIIRLAQSFGVLPNLDDQGAWARMSASDTWWREHAERRKRENINGHLGRRPRGSAAGEWLWG